MSILSKITGPARSPQVNARRIETVCLALQLLAVDPANLHNVPALLSLGAMIGRLTADERAAVIACMSATANSIPAGGGLR